MIIAQLTSLARLAYGCPKLKALRYRVLSRDLVGVQNMAWALGALGAEGRVAAFLQTPSARHCELGSSCCSFNLRMTRQQIGSYRGPKLETVSRALSALNSPGIIQVLQRSIDILDADTLRGVFDPAASFTPRFESALPESGASTGNRVSISRPPFQPGLARQ